jgi:hypothetical protein
MFKPTSVIRHKLLQQLGEIYSSRCSARDVIAPKDLLHEEFVRGYQTVGLVSVLAWIRGGLVDVLVLMIILCVCVCVCVCERERGRERGRERERKNGWYVRFSRRTAGLGVPVWEHR